MKSRLLPLITLLMLLAAATAKAQEYYNLWLAGIAVSAVNQHEVSGEGITGKVSYNPTTNVLTLTNATINSPNKTIGLRASIKGLKIELVGKNKIDGGNAEGIWTGANTAIGGPGTLEVLSRTGSAIFIMEDTLALLPDCQIMAQGLNGVAGRTESSQVLVVHGGALLKATGTEGSITELLDLQLMDSEITAPVGAVFNKKRRGVFVGNSLVSTVVLIKKKEPASSYKLFVAGVQVTSDNASQITSPDLLGTASYDQTNNILSFKGVSIKKKDNSAAIYSEIEGLAIHLEGENKASTVQTALDLRGSTTIRGPGKLSITSAEQTGIAFPSAPLSIVGECELSIAGKHALSGDSSEQSKLIIKGSTVKANGEEASINAISGLELVESCIEKPIGATYDDELKALALNGEKVSGEVLISKVEVEAYNLWVGDVPVTSANQDNIQGENIKRGKISYNPTENILLLDGAEIISRERAAGIRSAIEKLTIRLVGENKIVADKAEALWLGRTTHIEGKGSLLATSAVQSAILIVKDSLSIAGGCTVTAKGVYGISGRLDGAESLLVNGSIIRSTGADGSIADLKRLLLTDCAIVAPQGAAFSEKARGVAINDELTPEEVLIRKRGEEAAPIPMIVKGNKWKVLIQSFEYVNEEGKRRGYRITSTKIYELTKAVEIDGKKYYHYSPFDCYLREADGKVYFLDAKKKTERVAFDYSLKVGDFFFPLNVYRATGSFFDEKCYIKSIEKVFVAGKERRVYYFSPGASASNSTEFDNFSRQSNSLKSKPHPASIFVTYPNINAGWMKQQAWIEGIGGLVHAVFHHPFDSTGGITPPGQLLCFVDSDGVEHDLSNYLGCNVNERTLVSSGRPEDNSAPFITLQGSKLTIIATSNHQHKVALFTLDGKPLLLETSFIGSFEAQLPRYDTAQPLLLVFDGKGTVRLHHTP